MRSRNVALFLALFTGGVGFHKFYLGKIGQGILYFLFFWTFIPAFLALIDLFKLLTMSEDKFQKLYHY